MGSFNISCFATRQIINPNHSVKVVPVLQESAYHEAKATFGSDPSVVLIGGSNSCCYSNAFWSPLSPFIDAKYADYGNFEFSFEGHNRKFVAQFLNTIFKAAAVVDQGENEYHEKAFNFQEYVAINAPVLHSTLVNTSWFEELAKGFEEVPDEELIACMEYVAKGIWDSRVFVKNYNGIPREVTFAVVSAITFDTFVSHIETTPKYGRNPVTRKAAALAGLAAANRQVASIKKIREQRNLAMSDVDVYFSFSEGLLSQIFSENSSTGFNKLRAPFEGDALALSEKFLAGTISEDEISIEMAEWLQSAYFVSALNYFNIPIAPSITGGQEYDNRPGLEYASLVSKISEAIVVDNKIQSFGDPVEYLLTLPVLEAQRIHSLSKLLDSWDGYMLFDNMTSDEKNVTFKVKVPWHFSDFTEIMQEQTIIDNFNITMTSFSSDNS